MGWGIRERGNSKYEIGQHMLIYKVVYDVLSSEIKEIFIKFVELDHFYFVMTWKDRY